MCVLAAVLLASALLKAASPTPAIASLRHLAPWLDPTHATVVTFATAALEVAVAAIAIATWRSRACGVFLLAVMAALSVPLAILTADPLAPHCGCFGAMRIAKDAQLSNGLGLLRNGGLLVAALWLAAAPAPVAPVNGVTAPA